MLLKTPKPTQLNPEGGILETEAAIHVSNVQLLDPKTNEPTRVGYKTVDGKKFVSLKNQAKKLKLIINNQLKGGSTLNRLKEKFNTEVTENLVKKFNYSSVMEVPKIEKIVVNMGVGDAVQNSKVLDNAVEELELITGQNHQ